MAEIKYMNKERKNKTKKRTSWNRCKQTEIDRSIDNENLEKKKEETEENHGKKVGWLVGWFILMAYEPLQVIYCQINVHTNNHFYFKQFSLEWVHSLIVTNISISSYSVYSVQIQLIQFGIRTDIVYTQLNVKTVQY